MDRDSLLLYDDVPLPEGGSASDAQATNADTSLRWRVLVVDDDRDVRTISQLALHGVTIDGIRIDLTCLGSAAAARQWLSESSDVAVVIIDVVMESETAGLDLVQWIRTKHVDRLTRLILRTGQPGTAPEARVMSDYDVHDYLSKAETTARRLITSVTGAVRAWRDMRTISEQRAGLQRALHAVGSLFDAPGLKALLQAILDQVTAMLFPRKSSLLFIATPDLNDRGTVEPLVLAATGEFAAFIGMPVQTALGQLALSIDVKTVEAGRITLEHNRVLYAFDVKPEVRPILVIDGGVLQPWECELVELYCHAVTLALRNRRMWDAQLAWLQALEKFVPTTLSALTGQTDIRLLKAGDSAIHTLTVCFVDVRGFTERTSRIGGPAAFRMLNTLFAALGEVITHHGGIIDKYLGDGLLVVFPRSASDAVRAALAMQKAANAIEATEQDPLRIGVGLHHGEVIVGAVGYPGRLDLSVVASVVNGASRVQDLTKWLHADVLFTDEVYQELDEALRADCRPLLVHRLRGDEARRVIWQSFGTADSTRRALYRETLTGLSEATALTASSRWQQAQERLLQLLDAGDPIIQALLDYIERRLAEGDDGGRADAVP